MVNTNLRINGLATGIDTESIVQDLMKIARMPLDRKVRDKQTWTWKQEGYRSVNLTLLNLKNTVFNMKLESPYLIKQATSGDENIVEVSATAAASAGTYSLRVTQLAAVATNQSSDAVSSDPGNKIDTSQSILSQSALFANPGAFFDGKTEEDTFTVTANGQEYTFTYGDSLDKIIGTINSDKEAKISIFYDSYTDKIALSSTVTGADARLEVTGEFFIGVLKVDNGTKTGGKDAVFELNGLVTQRPENSFTISGVTFNLKGLSGTEPTRVDVKTDTDGIFNMIKNFVDNYNEIIETVNTKLKEEYFADFYPLTDEEKEAMSDTEIQRWEEKAKSGQLRNNPLLSGIISEMRITMSSIISGVSGPAALAQIGITTGSYWNNTGGKLIIDESKLRTAIENDPEGVAQLFNNDSEITGEQGIAVRLYEVIDSGIGRITAEAGSGSALYDNSYISRTVRSIDEQISIIEERLIKLEERYWRQFTAMEKAISSMNQQSNWLTSQFMQMQQ